VAKIIKCNNCEQNSTKEAWDNKNEGIKIYERIPYKKVLNQANVVCPNCEEETDRTNIEVINAPEVLYAVVVGDEVVEAYEEEEDANTELDDRWEQHIDRYDPDDYGEEQWLQVVRTEFETSTKEVNMGDDDWEDALNIFLRID
jgi:hypothetical protein